MNVRFGAIFGRHVPPAKTAEWAARAENNGYSHIGVPDSQLLARDCYVALATAASRTSTLRIGVAVTNPVTRHPAVTANLAATLNELSDGRFFVGIGTGASSLQPMGQRPVPLRQLREYTLAVKELLGGATVKYGNHEITMPSWAVQRIPVLVACTGPKARELAGEIGDGVISANIGVNIPLVNFARRYIDGGLKRSGRDPSQLTIFDTVPIGIDRDVKKARQRVEPLVAVQASQFHAAWKAVTHTLPPEILPYPEFLDDVKYCYDASLHQKYEMAPTKGHLALPDRLIDQFGIHGTPDMVRERLEAFIDSTGAETVQIGLATHESGPELEEHLDLFGREIIRKFS